MHAIDQSIIVTKLIVISSADLEFIDHKRVISKAELDNMNNQISILRRTMHQLSAEF